MRLKRDFMNFYFRIVSWKGIKSVCLRRFITANAIDFILSFGHDSRSRKAGYKKRTPRVRYAVPLGSDASDPRGTVEKTKISVLSFRGGEILALYHYPALFFLRYFVFLIFFCIFELEFCKNESVSWVLQEELRVLLFVTL